MAIPISLKDTLKVNLHNLKDDNQEQKDFEQDAESLYANDKDLRLLQKKAKQKTKKTKNRE